MAGHDDTNHSAGSAVMAQVNVEEREMKFNGLAMTAMRVLFVVIFGMAWMTLTGHAQEKKAPEKLVFETKMGNVTFDHAKHGERAKGDCSTCHDSIFPQTKAPLNFKEKLHQVAEANKTSCASCHHAGGPAFASKGQCNTCHVKK